MSWNEEHVCYQSHVIVDNGVRLKTYYTNEGAEDDDVLVFVRPDGSVYTAYLHGFDSAPPRGYVEHSTLDEAVAYMKTCNRIGGTGADDYPEDI